MIDKSPSQPNGARRDFLKKGLAGSLGVLLGLAPAAAGLVVFFDPLRRKSASAGVVKVTSLQALPDDGLPHKFPILADRVDAWTKSPLSPIGAVYLRRTGNVIEALNVVCPHAGCFVDYLPDRNLFLCPCHNSTFTLTGKVQDRSSPAARGLDTLEVDVRDGNEVWVKFQNFQAGRAEKVPVV